MRGQEDSWNERDRGQHRCNAERTRKIGEPEIESGDGS